ncbi:MAG: type II toxin-antitoxin system PemK/MazF family toxin [Campylobacterota bacterium]|nr:type II toxin-antitoxin system PemK/MazF family toxin [Campylobacterota bacterium]
MLKHDEWNEVKKKTQNDKKVRLFKQRDIFFIKMGENIGYEQNGKGTNFVRPIVVLKKITSNMFIGIPLSTQIKSGSWFYKFEFKAKNKSSENIAIIPQLRMFSSQRLLNKIGVMPNNNFDELRRKVKDFID